MKNKISESLPALLAMAGQTSTGAGQYPALLVLTSKAALDADITALVDSIMDYGEGKNLLQDYRETLAEKVDASRELLMFARDTFKPVFGIDYNSRWDVTGLVGTTAIPYKPEEVVVVLRSFKELLAANPAYEIPLKDITATKFDDMLTELTAALAAVNTQAGVAADLIETRNAKADALRERMTAIISELKIKLDGLDNRWTAFGLNKPGALESPDEVEGVQATLIGPTAAALKWDAAARAEYYHVFKRVQGVDQDYVLVGSPADLDFTIENLPTNATIEIQVSAVNNGGESPRSTSVTIVTHV